MAKGRREDALKAMIRLRKKDTPVELLQEEMELLAMADANQGKGTWKEIFQGRNRVTPPPHFLPPRYPKT